MAEYIERGAAKAMFNGIPQFGATAEMMIDCVPAADVAEVRHGEWIYHECVSSYDGAISGYSCSLCGAFVDEEIFESDKFHDEFCGHCGADMRGEKHEDL